MKITRKQLRQIIREAAIATSQGDAGVRNRARQLKSRWDSLDIQNTRRPEADDAAEDFLRGLWDNTESSWAKNKGLTTGGKGDPAGPAWSAATISTIVDDEKVKSIRHSDYRKGGQERRKQWDSADPDAAKNIEWVAFEPDELEPMAGDLRCCKRIGGTHCDICMDAGCTQVVGGNVKDDLYYGAPECEKDMYIASSAEKIEAESDEESDATQGVAEMKITRSRLRQIIKEELNEYGEMKLGKLPTKDSPMSDTGGQYTITNPEQAQSEADHLLDKLTVSQHELQKGYVKTDQWDERDEALLNDLMQKMEIGDYPFSVEWGTRS